MAQQATTSLANWKFHENHVQSELQGGQFVSAATILIAAGPPRLADASGGFPASTSSQAEIAFPIGVVENFGMSQNRQLQRMFEIGSKRSYFIPGRTIGSVSLGRVLFFGPSLLRVMYAYYPTSKFGISANVANPLAGNLTTRDLGNRTPEVLDKPGFGATQVDPALNADFWVNLASDLFDHPCGLLVYLRDAQNEAYGAFYLEDVNLQAHQFNVNASSVLVAEGTSAQYDKLIPVNIAKAKVASPSIVA
ncbi:hypothetical protein LCGC14_0430710 [marine sediment metagenome]|uniref:Uncharacterized protein n=1 Tax=marine sediment metagenome TaxID=412755 RepID=A0A0F9VXQ5_9ZZZZ